ncbi:AlbA family DNA-binding domain-containing protein [Zhihengliuella salsuginis]|uniref:Schlafen AlbA-2 domain-containing protein n=1 Tax=Zhihengliuella salsuginis TaxID=578222 RepID=A0ABQ3GA17_9MICC|nr:ATP-binding protein [Zhihengliuella salsuginis]GHC99081.1 hypothetical protein GCM10008096_00860 [Zhihengliuella salsuginis]
MKFTALHRALGLPPQLLTLEILQQAMEAGVAESDDLDWKSQLPDRKNLAQSDVPKDVAAMANSGGGIIVYGVEEQQKAATGLKDTGELDEGHERALRSVAVTAISPPVFGLKIQRLGTPTQVVVLEVPASIDGPHLIYRGEYFGAPVRNDADTVWMKERQLEAMYRARFDERRNATEDLDNLYAEQALSHDIESRAWLIAVAQPRLPGHSIRLTRGKAQSISQRAEKLATNHFTLDGLRPFTELGMNPRRGLRRWNTNNLGTVSANSEAWIAIHDNGSATLAVAVGGRRNRDDSNGPGQVEGHTIEYALADFGGLLRALQEAFSHDEYGVRIGIEWGGGPLCFLLADGFGNTRPNNGPSIRRYAPVRSTLTTGATLDEYHRQIFALTEDCLNQGGITELQVLIEPTPDD